MNNHKNRGMELEYFINKTNEFYRLSNRALIYKKPTPIQIVSVEYGKNKHVINKAYFSIPSTTDYNGIYKGKYIDFEAKQTSSLKSLSLSQIHNHQIDHLLNVNKHGGISFLMIYFKKLEEIYIIFSNKIEQLINNNNVNSISLSYLRKHGYKLKLRISPYIDYLEVIDEVH